MSISNQLAETTFRIVVQLKNGISTGSGFLYSVKDDKEKNTSVPVLITNKHVVKEGLSGALIVTATDRSGKTTHLSVNLVDFPTMWRDHPDKDIDLTAMPIVSLMEHLHKINQTPRIKWLSSSDIPTTDELASFNFVEDVLMVGYPNGLWDNANNYPLFRKGITATHPGKDFQGRKEFVVDIAAFPGSSGSPVFLYNEGSYATQGGNLALGIRIKLLGILYAGPQYTADGQIVIQTVPTQQIPLSKTSIPMNLGYVISSQVLAKFAQVF